MSGALTGLAVVGCRRSLRPVAYVLQASGFLPLSLAQKRCVNPAKVKYPISVITSAMLVLLNLLYIVLNLGLLTLNVISAYVHYVCYGAWHPVTMQATILGLKPLQCSMNLAIFLVTRGRHDNLLQQFYAIGKELRQYGRSGYRVVNVAFYAAISTVFLVTITLRRVNHLVMQNASSSTKVRMNITNNDTKMRLNSASLLHTFLAPIFVKMDYFIVPATSVWQLAPLLYYVSLLYLLRKWTMSLRGHIASGDVTDSQSNLREFMDTFDKFTRLHTNVSNAFGPYIVFNLCVSIGTLCMTVYFFSYSQEMANIRMKIGWIYYFNIIWSALQIGILIIFIVVVYVCGFLVNEAVGTCFTEFFKLCTYRDDLTCTVLCMSEKLRNHGRWGIFLWKGHLVKRGQLFTVVGMILTYALVLLRLRSPANQSSGKHDQGFAFHGSQCH